MKDAFCRKNVPEEHAGHLCMKRLVDYNQVCFYAFDENICVLYDAYYPSYISKQIRVEIKNEYRFCSLYNNFFTFKSKPHLFLSMA